KALLKAAKKLELDKFLFLGNGQRKAADADAKLFSSVYEALVAGIYLDGGIKAAKKFVTDTALKEYALSVKKKKSEKGEDHKSALQEYVQKNKTGSIVYETLSKTGPDHMPEFRVALLLNGKPIAEGKGASKKEAEMKAAEKALKKLKS
ncbi:MAG: ribonuclease III, partial [Clostridia bacterium]|nr:ribonuclease III [Clostridia bacterium]